MMTTEKRDTFQDNDESKEFHEKFVDIAGFFIYGFVPTSIGMTFLSATEDLLSGASLPSTVFLLSATTSYMAAAVIVPNFLERLPQLAANLAVFLSLVTGLLLLALSSQIELKFVGVIINGIGLGVGEVSFMGLTAYYSNTTVQAYCGGGGAGFLFSNIFYTGMTTWLCISPSTTLLVLLVMPPLLPVCYCLMDQKQRPKYVSEAAAHKEIPYSSLNSAKQPEHSYLTCKEKLQVIWQNRLLFLSIYIGCVCEYVTIQAIVTTLAFPSAPFDPRDHYQYYTTAFVTGDSIGRIYGLILSLLKCNVLDETRHTWIFTLLIFVNAQFLWLAAWYRFLNSVYIVFAVLFVIGLNAGALYYNTFAVASRGSSSRHIEVSRSFLCVAVGAGVLSAGFLGLKVEPLLKEHCELSFNASSYCLTRSMQGWKASFC